MADAGGLFADLKSQCLDHGEFAVPAAAGLIRGEQVRELGAVIDDPKGGRRSEHEITIADLTGLAAEDIAMARIVLAAVEAQT